MKTTKIAGLDHIVAWDDSEQHHVYLDGGDLVFRDNEVVHVGPGYAGPVDTTIDGKGFMAIPGFVNVHSHPFSEPANKGLTEEYGSDKLGQSSLYEYLTVYGLAPEDAGPSTQVALSELLKSGVTTITDLSMARDGWVEDLAKTGIRAVVCPMMRQGVWFTQNGHTVDYAWDEKAGEKAFESSMKTIDEALKHPSGRIGGMAGPAQIDTCREGFFREALQEAKKRGIPMQTHACQAVVEFYEMVRRHGKNADRMARGHRRARPRSGDRPRHLPQRPSADPPSAQQRLRAPARLGRGGGALPDRVRAARHGDELDRPLHECRHHGRHRHRHLPAQHGR